MFKDVIETKDLLLAKAKLEDLESIYQNFWKDKNNFKYMLMTNSKSLEEAKERLDKTINFQKDHMAYFIYEKKSGQAIGMAGMLEISPSVFEDCGIGMGRNFVGQGYGKQLLSAMVDYLFEELNAKKVICSCFEQNIPSAKMMLGCGFKFVGVEEKVRKRDNLRYTIKIFEKYNENA